MRLSRLLSCLGLCLALLACTNVPSSTPSTTVDYDHSFDFSHVHKIAIQPIAKDTLATMLISDEQIGRINGALTAELRRRNFEVVTNNADADMYLSWRFVFTGGDTLATFDPATTNIVQGTLYVNMIDPVMLQARWRATFKTDLRDRPETPEAAAYRREAAEAILAQFPPGKP